MHGNHKFLRAGEIATELGICERTVRRWMADGTLPSAKIGGARLVARSELERLLECSQPALPNEEKAIN